jgi:hypothetical protein
LTSPASESAAAGEETRGADTSEDAGGTAPGDGEWERPSPDETEGLKEGDKDMSEIDTILDELDKDGLGAIESSNYWPCPPPLAGWLAGLGYPPDWNSLGYAS